MFIFFLSNLQLGRVNLYNNDFLITFLTLKLLFISNGIF